MGEKNGDAKTVAPTKEMRTLQGVTRQNKLWQINPQNLSEAMAFAKMMAESDLVPRDYRGKQANCLIAMQWGAELAMSPMQAVQNIAVINGKPGLYGDIGKALLQSKGFKIEERDMKDAEAKQEAWCRITRPDNGVVVERTFTVKNAQTAKLWGREGVWTNYPYRQLGWRAFWFAARDAASDVLKGLGGAEELIDVIDTTAEIEHAPKELTPEAPALEPTPEQPVVDVPAPAKIEYITPDERKYIVELLAKKKMKPEILKDYLATKYGISDAVKPTALIPRSEYQAVCAWIENPQAELGV